MAYNNFPVGYQPMYYQQPMQQPVQQQSNGIIWVQGEAGAKSYLVAPGNTVQLWDSESQVIYLKSADATGLPSMRVLDYTIRDNTPQRAQNVLRDDFVTRDEVLSIKKQIDELETKLSEIRKEAKHESTVSDDGR